MLDKYDISGAWIQALSQGGDFDFVTVKAASGGFMFGGENDGMGQENIIVHFRGIRWIESTDG